MSLMTLPLLLSRFRFPFLPLPFLQTPPFLYFLLTMHLFRLLLPPVPLFSLQSLLPPIASSSFLPPSWHSPTRWHLVQVDVPQSLLNPAFLACAAAGRCCCHFLGKHPDNASLPDPPGSWWLLMHRFSTSADGSIDFGARVLFNPITTPAVLR
jgi:hypothetical protein